MKPYFWALLAAVVWGFAPIVEKMGLMKMPVWTGLFFRSLGVFCGLILIACFQFTEIKQVITKDASGWFYLFLGGILASILGQIFFYRALSTGQASQVVPLGACYPLISFVLGILFLHEMVTWPKLAGLIFVITGAILLK